MSHAVPERSDKGEPVGKGSVGMSTVSDAPETPYRPAHALIEPEPVAAESRGADTAVADHRTPWRRAFATIAAATVAVTLVLLAFVWPSYTSKVHHLPLTVVAPQQVQQTVVNKLSESGAFNVSTVSSRDELVNRIKHRDTYGGLVITPTGVEVLTASAASPVAAQAIQGAGQGLAQAELAQMGTARGQAAQAAAQAGAKAAAAGATAKTLGTLVPDHPELAPQAQAAAAEAKAAGAQAQAAKAKMDAIPTPSVKVTDVVPLSSHDTRGTAFAIMSLPLAMGGMLGGILVALGVHGLSRRLVLLPTYGIVGGLVLVLVLHPWLHVLQGNFWLQWMAMALALLGTASFIVGARHLLGTIGMSLAAVITMFLGNPLSSMSAPTEMLPWHWGTIGQFLVPGAAGTLLRLLSYFPDASTTRPWLVLIGWSLFGLLLNIVAHRHHGPTSAAGPASTAGAPAETSDAVEPAPAV